jgi:hypothetical protein
MTHNELLARHAVLEVKFAAAQDGLDDGRRGDARALAAEMEQIEAEIKTHPDHAAYIQSLIDAGALVAAKHWQ